MKKITITILTIFIVLIFAGCSLFGIRIDTSNWILHELGETGISVLLPEDMAVEDGNDGSITLSNDEVRFTVTWEDELYPDLESLAGTAGRDEEIQTEIVRVSDTELVQLLSEEDLKNKYYGITSDGDTYCVVVEASEDSEIKHAGAVISAITETICIEREDGAESSVTHDLEVPASETDTLVLVNERIPLPDNWEDMASLVSIPDSKGEMVKIDRSAGKAFLKLRQDLLEEGIDAEIDAAYEKNGSDHPEHETGLALDLYLTADGTEADAGDQADWSMIHDKIAEYGFILRYPEGGEYYTGCDYLPQHIRYVGVEAAERITGENVTLEEYLGKDPASVDYMVLVNKEHALPENWEDKIELTYMTNNSDEEIGVERITYEAYLKLKEALLEDGVHTDINTAYRSVQDQKDLTSEFLVKYGEDYVRNYVAEPGFSEHHTGLAIDLYLESVDAWAKIEARLPEFGFILRYPQGKEDVTGYSYEPWHIRYVGKDAAEAIMSEGLTLEEYIGRQAE